MHIRSTYTHVYYVLSPLRPSARAEANSNFVWCNENAFDERMWSSSGGSGDGTQFYPMCASIARCINHFANAWPYWFVTSSLFYATPLIQFHVCCLVVGHLTAASSKSILMRYVRVSCVLHRLETSAPFILALMLISWIIAERLRLEKTLEFKWLPFEIFFCGNQFPSKSNCYHNLGQSIWPAANITHPKHIFSSSFHCAVLMIARK